MLLDEFGPEDEDDVPEEEDGQLIAHLRKMEPSSASGYHKYLPVKINGVQCDALVDSGNTWRSVISIGFMRALGLKTNQLLPPPPFSINTAKQGQQLEVLGIVPRSLSVKLSGDTKALLFQPAVLRDLTMPVILSGPFLKRHQINQIHTQNCLSINGRRFPLKAKSDDLASPFLPEKEGTTVKVHRRTSIPAFSIGQLSLVIPRSARRTFAQGDCVLFPDPDFARTTRAVPPTCALVAPDEAGLLHVQVMNTYDHPITIPNQHDYGVLRLACASQDQARLPWRVAVMAKEDLRVAPSSDRPGDRPTLRQRLAEVVRRNQEKALSSKEKKKSAKIQFHNDEEKKAWLRTAFNIEKSPCLPTKQLQQRAVDLLFRYWEGISKNGEFGHTTLLQHEIHTDPGPPIKTRNRPINPSLEGDLREQINHLLHHDVIEPSNSPWSFALVAAPKKNGKIRWCVDYRRLNDITRKDTFPLPHIEDNLARLSDSAVFSCIDGSGAFHVLEIRPQDRPKTAFSTPWGLYQYKRMPFGLTNGPASYSRLVQLVLQGIPTEVALPYLDDTIIHSADVESHFTNLERVLRAHTKAGLKLQPEKCHLFQAEVEYLGHTINKDGIRPIASYTAVVRDWPVPTTKSEARVFWARLDTIAVSSKTLPQSPDHGTLSLESRPTHLMRRNRWSSLQK